MANPQKEHGFTGFSNELLEAIIAFPFNAYELKTILAVARETYGWSRKKAQISYRAIAEYTGMSRRHAYRTCLRLECNKVIFIQKTINRMSANVIGINKNYEEWKVGTSQGIAVAQNVPTLSPQMSSGRDIRGDTSRDNSGDTSNKERNIYKEKRKKAGTLFKSYLLSLIKRHKSDKLLIKECLFKQGYTEAQIENAFEQFKINLKQNGGG